MNILLVVGLLSGKARDIKIPTTEYGIFNHYMQFIGSEFHQNQPGWPSGTDKISKNQSPVT